MITIAQSVSTIINQKPFLAEAISEGIINISSLARQIQPEIEQLLHKTVNEGAVVMALKRFVPQVDTELNVKLMKTIKNMGDIIVRSNLCDFTFKNSETLFQNHITVLKSISLISDIFYTFVQGIFESTLVISDLVKGEVQKEFKNGKLISLIENLSAITMRLPLENTVIPGFYYFILRKLAWDGINIIEVISTSNEFTIVVNDNDVDRAFSVLKSLKK